MRRKEPHGGSLAGQPLSKEQGRNCRKAADYRGASLGPQVVTVSSSQDVHVVVLDSNVVLGLFWFQDPDLSRLATALEAGQLRWCITAQMRDELRHVMTRGALAPSTDGAVAQGAAIRAERVMAEVERLSHLVPSAASLATPRCTDPQDQMFIDLALGVGARWLFSRDKAVLKLNRKAFALRGCSIVRPQDWQPCTTNGDL